MPQTFESDDQATYRTRLAETSAAAAREALRVTEQTILLNAAAAYMDLLRDGALLELQRRNVQVERQRRCGSTLERLDVAERPCTPT